MMNKKEIGDYVLYVSSLIPDGTILFCTPQDAALVIESLEEFEKENFTPDQKKIIAHKIEEQLKSRLRRIDNIGEE